MTLLDVLKTSTPWAFSKWAHSPLNSGPFFAETSNNITLLPSIVPLSSLLTSPTPSLISPTPSLPSPSSSTAGLGPHPHGSDALRTRLHVAHGVLASATMVVLFPSVAIVLRVVASRHIVRWHYTM